MSEKCDFCGDDWDDCQCGALHKSSARPTGSTALLEPLAQAASDYKMAHQNQEFAELNGGIETMRRNLFAAVTHYERAVDDETERG